MAKSNQKQKRAGSSARRGARDPQAAGAEARGRGPTGDCRAQLAELFAYLDGELTPERCGPIERHLRTCACCGTLANSVLRAIAVCRRAGRERLPGAARARARMRIRRLLGNAPLPPGGKGPKGPDGNRLVKLGVEAPGRPGATSAHRGAYVSEKQRRRSGCIGGQVDQSISAGAPKVRRS